MTFEKWLSGIIRERGINLSELSRRTKLPYQAIYASLFAHGRDRELRSGELIAICGYLGIDPMEFARKRKEVRGEGQGA